MARRSARSIHRRFRRTRLFAVANLVLWAGIGIWYVAQPPDRREDVARLVRNAFDSRKDVTAFDVAWDLWQIHQSDAATAAITPGERTHLYGGVPAGARPVRVLVNSGYTVGYSDALGVPLWAAYHVRDGEFGEAPPRPDEFSVDRRTTARIDPADYARSGFDRGHLAPNHAIALHYGPRAQLETFLMSNIVPQRHALNSGPWSQLERRIARNYPARFGEVWVLVGPILAKSPSLLAGRVAVPEAFFAIVVDEVEGRVRAEAFILPQDAPADASLAVHGVSIDEIERRTGLDLLSELSDAGEAALEAAVTTRAW